MGTDSKARFVLPAAEDDLWEQVALALLRQRDVSESQAQDRLRLMEELAFHSKLCGRRLTRTFSEDTATWLAEERKFGSPRDKARKWLADLECWELLIQRGSGHDATYELPIPGLDEYFAARHLAVRWAEEDERYLAWLPCSEGWWEKAETLTCPNRSCRTPLPAFHEIVCSTEHEETLLLMVCLLKEVTRENVFLNGISHIWPHLNFKLLALARCHYAHAETIPKVLEAAWLAKRMPPGLFALGRARIPSYLDLLIDALGHKKPEVVAIAALTLGDLRLKQAVGPLIALLKMRHGARAAAVSALAHIGSDEAIGALISALRDEDKEVRWAAAMQLKTHDVRTVDAFVEALSDESWEVRHCAALYFVYNGEARVIPVLCKALNDPMEPVRDAASRALKRIKGGLGR